MNEDWRKEDWRKEYFIAKVFAVIMLVGFTIGYILSPKEMKFVFVVIPVGIILLVALAWGITYFVEFMYKIAEKRYPDKNKEDKEA